jgi:hypothetical protein
MGQIGPSGDLPRIRGCARKYQVAPDAKLKSESKSKILKAELMRIFVLAFVLAVAFGCPALLGFATARAMAVVQGTESPRLTAGPELEMATESTAIISWTTTNPGGTALHFGIVHYGTDPGNLTQVAKSPNRRNPSHPDMIFRVRITRLTPATTYYYTVESVGSTGVSDGVFSPVRTFKTR